MSVDRPGVTDLCRRHVARQDSLVMLLQDVQSRYGYLPREALKAISREVGVPLARLYGLATFYRSFSLTPRGKHEICVCTGTACHVRGATSILQSLERRLGITSGQTSKDGLLSLVAVNCLGACALGPVMVVDGKCHGNMTIEKLNVLLAGLTEEAVADSRGI